MSVAGTLRLGTPGGTAAPCTRSSGMPFSAAPGLPPRRVIVNHAVPTAQADAHRRVRRGAQAAGPVMERVENQTGVRADPRRQEKSLEPDWSMLVTRCMHGDSGAWAELVKTHHRRVYGLCYRFTGSSHDSEDLTQEVFLKVYGNLANFDSARGSFPVWLTTLTRNLLVDHFRRSRQQRVTDSMDAGWEDSDEQPMAERMADPQRSPHDVAASKEIERMVQEALTRVSPELREAVILRDLQDLDYKEIALVLKIPEGTVKSRISRGRAELARLLERNKRQVV